MPLKGIVEVLADAVQRAAVWLLSSRILEGSVAACGLHAR